MRTTQITCKNKIFDKQQQKQRKIRVKREFDSTETSFCSNREITTEKKENISDWIMKWKGRNICCIEGISQNKKMKKKYLNHKETVNIYENSTTPEVYSFIEMTNLNQYWNIIIHKNRIPISTIISKNVTETSKYAFKQCKSIKKRE